MKRLCFFLLFLGASVLFAAYPEEYPIYLRMLDFTADEIGDLQEGRFVIRSIEDRRPGEFGITAAKVFDVPGYFIRDYYSYVENFKSVRNFQQIGKFKQVPGLQDLAPLTLDASELQELAACRNDCQINLTSEEVAAFQKNLTVDLFRKILLDRVHQYLNTGNSAARLENLPHLTAYFPDVVRYLSDYPGSQNRRIPEFFYWVKEKIGDKNVIQIRHVFTQRVQEDFVMMDHLVYSNRSLISSAFVLHLINYVDGGFPRTLLVYHGRNYFDSESGRPATVDKRIFAAFRKAGEELEKRYLSSRAYPGFPFGLVPTDQR